MGFWTAAVLIVLIVFLAQVRRVRNEANPAALPDEQEVQELKDRVEALQGRVETLERIATEERRRIGLAQDIEALREPDRT
ncbi:hypothetical protein RM533_07745 [Croceicoccus sp. F390]|uniref:Phage shock protein B n=1 Tax=Croceicoccus esteveae TaxID=3075597 RepID=A0ABU2ZJ75_9SPHN|nr:hypothetical protein [Croceicoccus sp. F390]MDT0576078.1 hypothetical protein [Croceicoccus sp. F390]